MVRRLPLRGVVARSYDQKVAPIHLDPSFGYERSDFQVPRLQGSITTQVAGFGIKAAWIGIRLLRSRVLDRSHDQEVAPIHLDPTCGYQPSDFRVSRLQDSGFGY